MHIKVKVFTESNKEAIERISADKFECHLKEKPQNNAANKKLLSIIAEYLGLPENKIKIVKGHHSPSKILSVEQTV
ncbi:MAG: DUF167 domain-containing protein [Patescibacteria group bacterium]